MPATNRCSVNLVDHSASTVLMTDSLLRGNHMMRSTFARLAGVWKRTDALPPCFPEPNSSQSLLANVSQSIPLRGRTAWPMATPATVVGSSCFNRDSSSKTNRFGDISKIDVLLQVGWLLLDPVGECSTSLAHGGWIFAWGERQPQSSSPSTDRRFLDCNTIRRVMNSGGGYYYVCSYKPTMRAYEEGLAGCRGFEKVPWKIDKMKQNHDDHHSYG